MLKQMSIVSKRLMRSGLTGDYASAFKGAGMEFHQIREYVPGDDVRHIDWYSLVKTEKLMVKQFIQERDRQVILMIDISASAEYSSVKESRKEVMLSVLAGLATMAQASNDRIGVCLFSDHVEKWIAPTRGRALVHRLLEAVFTHTPISKKTDISQALRFLMQQKKQNAIVFILSDWIDDVRRFESLLRVAGKRHDLTALRFVDRCERMFPHTGYISLEDPESGQPLLIYAGKSNGTSLTSFLSSRLLEQRKLFEKSSIDVLDLEVGKPIVGPLLQFFHQRMRRSR